MAGKLATFLSKLASDNGIELDDEDLAQLEGLPGGPPSVSGDVLSIPIPGRAAGEVEIYLAADSTTVEKPVETKDNLMWYPIIREGQWAVRPGTQGAKKKVPLRVIAGHSKNQRKEIGLQDLLDAHNDQAIQHVTVPSSHNNTTLENQGFVDAMKIVDGKVQDKKTKTEVKVKVLLGGYRITEPETKGKLERGTIANRSAGILYDYVNTETGKTYPAVIEHVALTNKPWITGMVSFGRKLSEGGIETIGMSLSDDAPFESDEEYAQVLSLSLSDEDTDFLADAGITWDKENSPNWLRKQVDTRLSEARSKKMRSRKENGAVLYDDYPPYYRCVEAKPGTALISDSYGDDANFWVAPITLVDGEVDLSEFSKWSPVKKAYVADDRPAPSKDKLPLDQNGNINGNGAPAKEQLSRLELAQRDRRLRGGLKLDTNKDNNPPRGGGNMAGENGASLSDLSPEAQRLVQEAEARAAAAEGKVTKLSEQVQRLTGTVQSGSVKDYLSWLKSDVGLGLSEERGFGGVLVEVEQQMLADDGEPALQSEHFATDANKEGTLTLSEGIKRLFEAMHKATEGKKRLGEVLSEPADPAADEVELDEHGKPKLDAEGKPILKAKPEGGTNADETGGKPPAGEPDETKLSTDERVAKIATMSPAMAGVIGGVPKEPAGAGSGRGES